MVRKSGADYVIDYTKEDFTKNLDTYNCVIAVNGYQTIDEYKALLKDGGIYIPLGGSEQCAEAMKVGAEKFADSGKLRIAEKNQDDRLHGN